MWVQEAPFLLCVLKHMVASCVPQCISLARSNQICLCCQLTGWNCSVLCLICLLLSPYLKLPKENSHPGEVVESYEAIGIAPHTFSQNCLSLSVGRLITPHTEGFTLTQTIGDFLITVFGIAKSGQILIPANRRHTKILGFSGTLSQR